MFPFPDDFFSYLADLTNQEEQMIKEFMNLQVTQAIEFVKRKPEENGLTLATESDGVRVYLGNKKDTEDEDLQLVLSKVEIPVAADLMMNAAVTSSRCEFKQKFRMLDPMFEDGNILHKIPRNYDRYNGKTMRLENLNLPLYFVKWGAWNLPFPLSNRDFVFCECTCWAPDGMGVSMCISIPKITATVKSLEQSHSIVRGNIGMTGYFWKNKEGTDPKKVVGENAMAIDLTYVLQINVKGYIPRWAINLVGPRQGLNVKRVREYALKQRDLSHIFLDQNLELNGMEIKEELIIAGKKFEVQLWVNVNFELVYEWILEDHDIRFSIKGPDGEYAVAPASHSCNRKLGNSYHGRTTASVAGNYTLVFDNSSSWFTSKIVFYHCMSVDPNEEMPWPIWPTQKEALAVA